MAPAQIATTGVMQLVHPTQTEPSGTAPQVEAAGRNTQPTISALKPMDSHKKKFFFFLFFFYIFSVRIVEKTISIR